MKLLYSGRAKDDLELAFWWYEQQRYGLGHDFLDCVQACVATIIATPKLFARHHENFRRALIRRFPFAIFYTIERGNRDPRHF